MTPLLAESWTFSPDLKTLTFKLKTNVKFQNGEPFSSADVKAAFERYGTKDSTNKDKAFFASIESIETPALVIHGLEDRVVHVSTGRALAARMKNARRHLMSGVGHLPHLEAPRETAAKIERFLARLA